MRKYIILIKWIHWSQTRLITFWFNNESHSLWIDKCDLGWPHFSFKNVQKEEILKELNNLSINKATQNADLWTKIIKENSDIFRNFIFSNLNCCINTSSYLSLLKRADITPAHIKESRSARNNYRPVSILPNISKPFEGSCLNTCQNTLKFLFSLFINMDFRKGFSAQNCLVLMLEKWKSAIDNKRSFGAPFTDLSKAFNCLSHDLLTACKEP